MDKYGCDISVIAPVATSDHQVSSINSRSRSTDRLITLGAMTPDFPDIHGEFIRLKEKGVKGIKLHPDYQKFRCDEHWVYPIYEELCALDMFVLFHAGRDPGIAPPYGGTPVHIEKVARDFPQLKIIAAHMGGLDMWDEVEKRLSPIENIRIDTALCAGIIPNRTFLNLLSKFGRERVMMATDWPWKSVGETIQWIREFRLGDDVTEAILGRNAASLLHII